MFHGFPQSLQLHAKILSQSGLRPLTKCNHSSMGRYRNYRGSYKGLTYPAEERDWTIKQSNYWLLFLQFLTKQFDTLGLARGTLGPTPTQAHVHICNKTFRKGLMKCIHLLHRLLVLHVLVYCHSVSLRSRTRYLHTTSVYDKFIECNLEVSHSCTVVTDLQNTWYVRNNYYHYYSWISVALVSFAPRMWACLSCYYCWLWDTEMYVGSIACNG
jgi:hypothetical protein